MIPVRRLGQIWGREDASLLFAFLVPLLYDLSCNPLKISGCNLAVDMLQLRPTTHLKSLTFVFCLSHTGMKYGAPFCLFLKYVGQVARQEAEMAR